MSRILVWLMFFVAGAAAGVVAGLKWNPAGGETRPSVYAPTPAVSKPLRVQLDIQPAVPKLTAKQAETHRQDHYQDMTKVDDVLELPNDFAQTEALYALAGRADIPDLRTYILQADDIPNRYDRRAALQILFLRYAELDAHDALRYLDEIRLDIGQQMISSIFYSWAKVDVNAAVAAANDIVNAGRRRMAGDAILRAYGRVDPGMLKAVEAQLVDGYDLTYHDAQALAVTANHSPQAALEQALNLSNHQARQQALYSIGQVWARNDPQSALAHADTLRDQNARQMFRDAVMNRWAGDDPEAAVEMALAQPIGPEKDQLLTTALRSLAAQNPDAAFDIADGLARNARQMAYHQILQTAMQNSPDAALARLMTQPDSQQKDNLLAMAGMHFAQRNPQDALRWTRQLPSRQRSKIMENVIGQVAQNNPEDAFAVAMSAESPAERTRLLTTVINNVSYMRPELAASYAQQLPAGHRRDDVFSQIASQWAERDPDAALGWLSGLSDRAYRDAISRMGHQFARRDPDAAIAYLGRIREASRPEWISSIASTFAQRDPQRAASFVRQFANQPGYERVVSSVVPQLAHSDPAAAMRLAEGLSGDARAQTTMLVVSQWAAQDPVAAARWADGTRDATLRGQAVPGIVSQWAQHDARAATRWVMGMRTSETRDRAISTVIGTVDQSADQMLDLIAAIDSQDERNRAISNGYMRLRMQSNDAAAAQDFLERSGVSPEYQEALRSRMGGQLNGG